MVPLFPDLGGRHIVIPIFLVVSGVRPLTIKSTVIRPLSKDFEEYLNADGVFVPEGSDDMSVAWPRCGDIDGIEFSKTAVFDGCLDGGGDDYSLELVLRKWYPVDRSREVRCFVRDNVLIDTVDLLLTRDLSRGHIIDFNPFAPRTDPLLFTYEELLHIHLSHPSTPTFKVIDSRAHPAANLNSPAHQHNMIPFDTLTLSSGRDIDEFAAAWKDRLEKGMSGRPGDSDSE
ncbi:D123-domain-containing protein [Salix suchowensis]|nr:D123-domain-containing protein [Salix suchowensis]